MYDTTIPQTEEKRNKRVRTLALRHVFSGIASFVFGVLAVLLLVGVVVLVFIYEFGKAEGTLLVILLASFGGGTILSAVLAFALMQINTRAEKRMNDFLERCDGEESFFVGEGTLATFEKGELVLHSDQKEIRVPYIDLRIFSVCTRRQPRENGTWSVVFEIPARYLSKVGKVSKNDPPVLIQTDAKERLYAAIKAHDLELLGELPKEATPNKRFTPLAKFFLPNRETRKRSLILLALGAVVTVGGIPAWLFLDGMVGALLIVVGLFLAGRSLYAFLRARAMLAFYAEGIFWRESNRAESIFLKWEEVTELSRSEREGLALLDASTDYGGYHFPRPQGAWEYVKEHFPDKVRH